MSKKLAVTIIIIFGLAALGPVASSAQKSEVKAYEAYEQIDEHNQLPLDPYPPFGLLTGYICYPNQFYGWLKEFFENGHLAFDNGRKSKAAENAKDQKIEKLEAKVQRKDAVLAELLEEHVQLKKELGEI